MNSLQNDETKRNYNRVLWYTKPGQTWLQGLPLGNGRLGAMVPGIINKEIIQLNEDTVWARSPVDRNNPEAFETRKEVAKLLKEGRMQTAHDAADFGMMGAPRRQSPYQTLGELQLTFIGHQEGFVDEYHRELDLETGIASVLYKHRGAVFKREIFSSAIDQALVVRLTCDLPGRIDVGASLSRMLDSATSIEGIETIVMEGQCGVNGTQFMVKVRSINEGGRTRVLGNHLVVEQADAVMFILTVATDFSHKQYQNRCKQDIEVASAKPYELLKQTHVRDYQSFFGRMDLSISHGKNKVEADLPTDQRLQRVKDGGEDIGFTELYFHYGRYLLISSSRAGTMPANLQGIWNDSYTPSWGSKYTMNINLQMNYWPAEACNLAEMHTPLFDLLERIRINGRRTAEVHYKCRGFVCHHNTNLWADTAPTDYARTGLWPMGATWLCYHLWDHYEYHLDRTFLGQQAYPTLKEAAEFLLDYIWEDEDGKLLIGPTLSPENTYCLPDHQRASLCFNPAMDVQIVRGLLERCVKAAEILDTDDAFRLRLSEFCKRLPPSMIGQFGQLQEWEDDVKEFAPGHRHLSHLFGIYPDFQLTVDPEIFDAARVSLERRISHGGGGTGWSQAWIYSPLGTVYGGR